MNFQKKIKVVAVFSLIEHANEFYWYAKYIDKSKFELHCIFLNPTETPVQNEISALDVSCYFIQYRGKKNLPSALFKIMKLLKIIKPDIIHPQLFDASFITLTAAWLLGLKNRLHTRHHSDIHHKYHQQAVKYDKWINRLSQKIICPSEQTKSILIEKEFADKNKITVIRHGFDFDDFTITENQKQEVVMKYEIHGFPIIGVVSRFTEWKGVQYTIKAFEKLLKQYPDALLVLAGASGDYENEILNLLKQIPLRNYRVIKFEKEIYTLFSTFDIFVHVPISPESETFGQIYVEAFAMGIPSIITLSGIAAEMELFKNNSFVVPYQNHEAIYQSLISIIPNLSKHKEAMVEISKETQNIFSFANKITSLESLYLSLYNEQNN
ncbi:MAG: glycosyltransferase [Bacteroidales bacterium]